MSLRNEKHYEIFRICVSSSHNSITKVTCEGIHIFHGQTFSIKNFFSKMTFFNRRSPLSEFEIYCNKITFVLLYMNEFWVWFKKKSVMTKTVFIVLYKKEGGLNGIVHTFEKRQQRHKIGLPEIGLPIQPEMHSWGGHPNPTPPPQRESKMYCALQH